jgi:hypothetical protein
VKALQWPLSVVVSLVGSGLLRGYLKGRGRRQLEARLHALPHRFFDSADLETEAMGLIPLEVQRDDARPWRISRRG